MGVARFQFAVSKRHQHVAADHRAQKFIFLRVIAGQRHSLASHHDRGEIGLDHQAPAHGLHQHGGFARAAKATLVFRHANSQPAKIGKGLPGRTSESLFRIGRLASVGKVVLAFDKAVGTVLEKLLLLAEFKIEHGF